MATLKLCGRVLEYFAVFWKGLVLLLTPIILIPLALKDGASEEMRCAYVVLIMAVFWMTEALPLPVTSLLPMVAFPLLGIMSTSEVSVNYLKATNFMFVGGLIMALAVEQSGLHNRIALKVISMVGTGRKLLLLGFMLITGFLSMWISNTATTSMMVPIAQVVGQAVESQQHEEVKEQQELQTLDRIECQTKGPSKEDRDDVGSKKKEGQGAWRNLLLLSIAYAANIGGTGVITGSPPNLVVPQVLTNRFGHETGLTFASWMGFAVPLMMVNLLLCWLWLLIIQWIQTRRSASGHPSGGRKSQKGLRDIIQRQYEQLGPISCHEIIILICFIVVILLWFFRQPLFMPGWGDWFTFKTARGTKVTVGSATPVILMAIVVFALPSSPRFWPFQAADRTPKRSESILTWRVVETKLPWGVIFLLGGGFALSDACEKSGLSTWIITKLMVLKGLSPVLINFFMCLITAVITQVASNTATANVLLPILADMSLTICQNPIYLVMSVALTSSYAFCLPVATAPNAIVYEASTMTTWYMFTSGIVVNVITLITTGLAINSYASPLFNLDSFPLWAAAKLAPNQTCAVHLT